MTNTLTYGAFTIFADSNPYKLKPASNPGATVDKIEVKAIFKLMSSTKHLGCTVNGLGSVNELELITTNDGIYEIHI